MTVGGPPRAAAAGMLLLVAALAGAVGGCGYAFRPSTLPPHIKTIAIPVFRNRTTEPAVDSTITGAVVQAFSTDGRLRVVRADEADSILDGEVTTYRVESIAYDAQANVRRYRLVVSLTLTLRDVRREEVLLDRRVLTEQADFQVAGGVSETIVREDSALRAAATDIARAVVSFTVQRF